MTIDQLDKAIADWRELLSNALANTGELKKLLVYQLIQQRELRGKSQERADEIQRLMTEVEGNAGLIGKQVKKAGEDRKEVPSFFGRQDAIDKIEQLLVGDTIVLDEEEIALKDRKLDGATSKTHYSSCAKLRDQMNADFDKLKKLLFELNDHWTRHNDAYNRCRADADKLVDEIAGSGEPQPDELTQLLARLDSTKKRTLIDPLAITESIETTTRPYIEKARQAVNQIAIKRQAVQSDVEQAVKDLEEVRILRGSAIQAIADNKATARVAEPESTKDLQEWLDTIKDQMSKKQVNAARDGLRNWRNKLAQRKAACEQAIASAEAEARRVKEERGRVDADVTRMQQELSDLKELRCTALRLHAKCTAAMVDPPGLEEPQGTKALSTSKDEVLKSHQAGDVDATRALLSTWFAAASEVRISLEKTEQANKGSWEKLQLLRHRWTEAKEKLTKSGLELKGALKTFHDESEKLMAAEKIEFDKADTMVHSFASRLAEDIAKRQ